MTHTPAPWKLAGATTISNADKSVCIANVSTATVEQSEADANAKLIAAAPELLAALKSLVGIATGGGAGTNVDGKWMGVPDWSYIENAIAAITKAEGAAK